MQVFRTLLQGVNEVTLLRDLAVVDGRKARVAQVKPTGLKAYKVELTYPRLSRGYQELVDLCQFTPGVCRSFFSDDVRLKLLKASQQGVLFASCHEGELNVVRLYLNDSGVPTVFSNENDWVKWFSNTPCKPGEGWTKVLLLGNSLGQNTYARPFGVLTEKDPWGSV